MAFYCIDVLNVTVLYCIDVFRMYSAAHEIYIKTGM